MPKRLSKKVSKGLPTIKCTCGGVILLIPDVKLMGKALEAHVEEHRRKFINDKEAEVEAQTVMDDLVTKVLLKASKT